MKKGIAVFATLVGVAVHLTIFNLTLDHSPFDGGGDGAMVYLVELLYQIPVFIILLLHLTLGHRLGKFRRFAPLTSLVLLEICFALTLESLPLIELLSSRIGGIGSSWALANLTTVTFVFAFYWIINAFNNDESTDT